MMGEYNVRFLSSAGVKLPRAAHLVITIAGKKHWLWHAVDQEGFVLDVLVQSRRDKKAAKRLFCKLLKKPGRASRLLITDKPLCRSQAGDHARRRAPSAQRPQ
jgi:transposase-like protein